jgi:hypothetical protein
MGKSKQNAKFRTFYWKSRGETNSIWPNKIQLFSETTSLRCYTRRVICILFKIKENMLAVLKCWMGGCQCGRTEQKMAIILQQCRSTKGSVLRDITALSITRSTIVHVIK